MPKSFYSEVDDLTTAIGDLSDRDGYDFDQVKSIAKVQVCVFNFVILYAGVLISVA